MSLREYVVLIRRRWITIVVGLLVGVAVAVGYIALAPREYTAHITMFVSARGAADSVGSAYEGGLLAQQRIVSYTELLTSSRLARETVERLSLDESPDDVRGSITVTVQPDSTILDVGVRDRSPEKAAAIANKVGERFIALVDDIEKPNDPTRIPAVSAYVVEPASVPTRPSSPNTLVDLGFGLLLGLLAGLATAVVKNSLDTRIVAPERLAELVGARTLGSTARNRRAAARPLVVRDRPDGEDAESYRQLWTNLRFGDRRLPHKAVVVTSALPGEGKTTVACNLALAGADAGSRVLLVDANARTPMVGKLVGIDSATGFMDVLEGRASAETAIRSQGDLDVLVSGLPPENLGSTAGSAMRSPGQSPAWTMRGLLEDLGPRYDRILIDAPALLPFADAAALAAQADGVLLVVRHGTTTAQQAVDASNVLDAVAAPLLGSVLTMASKRSTASANGSRPGTPLLPAAPADDEQGPPTRTLVVQEFPAEGIAGTGGADRSSDHRSIAQ